MFPVLAAKAVSVAVAAWIGVSGLQVANSSISKEIIHGGITRIVRHEEIAKHRIKPPQGYKIHSDGIVVSWNPKEAQEIAKKLSQQGYVTQVNTDPVNEKARNVFKRKAPKTAKDRLASMFGSWVYWLDSYDYKKQAWVPDDDPAIQQQEADDRAWWKGLTQQEKRKYAEFITKRGQSVDQTLKDLEREYR
jgi:hypothetical protein